MQNKEYQTDCWLVTLIVLTILTLSVMAITQITFTHEMRILKGDFKTNARMSFK